MSTETWRPYTDPPETVGEYRLNDVFGHMTRVRWDGRCFRYAEGPYIGGVISHYKGDLWGELE